MKRIWNEQAHEHMYAFNEDAVHRHILRYKKGASRASELNEILLVLIAIATASFIFIYRWENGNFFTFLPAIMLLFTGVYVWVQRQKRLKRQHEFGKSMLGDLDHAIHNLDFEIQRSRTFTFWYGLPVFIPVLLNMYQKGVSWWAWVLIMACMGLSMFVVQLGLNYKLLPHRKKLEGLRKKLMEEK